MDHEEFFGAVRHLDQQDPDHHWPHDVQPGTGFDGAAGIVETSDSPFVPTEANWKKLGYNPPEHLTNFYPDADTRPTVRPKPTWAEIEAAASRVRVEVLAQDRAAAVHWLRLETQSRIAAAYGESSVEDEILLRLRGGQTTAQDTERERLRARYAAIKAQIDSMTAEQIKAFDPADDAHWAPPPTS